MTLGENTNVSVLLEQFPLVEEVFANFSVELDDEDVAFTIEELAAVYEINLETLLDALEDFIEDEVSLGEVDDEDDPFDAATIDDGDEEDLS